jgi:tetratricopeptide (TPR) repeat protein
VPALPPTLAYTLELCLTPISFLKQIAEAREQARLRKEAIRQKRQAKREAMLFREARSINGILNVVTVYKHSKRDIYLVTYNSMTQEVFSFVMQRKELRALLEAAHNTGSLTDNEMFIKVNMRILCDQLMYRRRHGGSVIVLSNKGGGERGTLVCRRGKVISGSFCVAQVYQYFKSYIFKVYNTKTCEIFRTELSWNQLNRWFGRDEADAIPTLMRPENRDDLIKWFLNRIFFCRGCGLLSHQARHKSGHDVLMLEYEKEDIRNEIMALRIQNMFRAKRARDMFAKALSKVMQKHWDPQAQQFYYLNAVTGAVTWTKPERLGVIEIEDPPDEWVTLYDENGGKYYYHQLTGRTAWMTEAEAATQIQRLFRKRQAKEFAITDMLQIVRALRFINTAKQSYIEKPDSLASIINYALLLHTQEFDYKAAKVYYKKAYELAPSNPLLLCSYGIFLLSEAGYPREQTWEQGQRMIQNALSMDPKLQKFEVAKTSFFHWSVVSNNKNSLAWLNWALINQCIDGEYNKAEKYYRTALDMGECKMYDDSDDDEANWTLIRTIPAGDEDERIIRNLEDFQKNRLPGGLYEGGGPGEMILRRSVVLRDGEKFELEAPEYQEMQDMEATDARFSRFYFHVKTGTTMWKEPDWMEIWSKRRKRSEMIEHTAQWDQYYDETQQLSFWHNLKEGIYTWYDPFAEFYQEEAAGYDEHDQSGYY